MTKNLKLTCLLLLFLVGARAQATYIFRHLTTADGLPNGSVKYVLHDRDGFLWIGTDAGLCRYDGYRYRRFTHGVATDNDLWSLGQDGLGRVWAARYADYYVYDAVHDDFATEGRDALARLGIKVNAGEPYQVFFDKAGDIFAFTSNRFFFYSVSQGKLATLTGNKPTWAHHEMELGSHERHVYTIDRDCNLWRFDKLSLRFTRIPLDTPTAQAMRGNHCFVFADSHGGLWLYANETGQVFRRDDKSGRWQRKLNLPDNHVTSMAEASDGHVWIATDHAGVFVCDVGGTEQGFTNLRHDAYASTSMAQDNVTNLCCSADGTIWLGHFKRGVSYSNPDFAQTFDSRSREAGDVMSLLQTRDGTMWIGTDGNGLWREQGGSTSRFPLACTAVMSLTEQAGGQGIWAGTYQDGVFHIAGSHVTHYDKASTGIDMDNAWSLVADSRGNLWAGSALSRLVKMDRRSGRWQYVKTDGEVRPLGLFIDSKDTLYVCTVNGLLTIDTRTGRQHLYTGNAEGTQRFSSLFISSVYKDSRGLLWIAHNKGLTVWDRQADRLYGIDRGMGLCDDIVHSMNEDGRADIWIGTTSGLAAIHVTAQKKEGQPRELRFGIASYTTRDGLHDNYFNSHATYRSPSGIVAMGSAEGYVLIDSHKRHTRDHGHKLMFTTLTIAGEAISVDSAYRGRHLLSSGLDGTRLLRLRSSDERIAIGFTTGNLINTNEVTYAYMLDGLDSEWTSTSDGQATFTNLPAGSYTLRVKARTADGQWSAERTIRLSVAPPFYRSVWALLLYAIVVLAVVGYAVHRARQKHREQMLRHEAMLSLRQAEMEREQEKQLSEMKLRFFTNISHDLRTPLTLIISPLRELLKHKTADGSTQAQGDRPVLQMVLRNAESLLALVNSLLDFRKVDAGAEKPNPQRADLARVADETAMPYRDYARQKGIAFTVSAAAEHIYMQLDIDKTRKIINNLLSNAFKFTPSGGAVDLRTSATTDTATIVVSDTGCGISDDDKQHLFEYYYQGSTPTNTEGRQRQQGSGLGLNIVHEYANLLGGNVSVADNQPQGTVFTVELPIADNASAASTATGDTTARHTILFVDDNDDLRQFVAGSLATDYHVLTAANGIEALDVLSGDDVEVVVSDVMMPDMDGTELCQRIKNDINTSHIPVVLLTARSTEQDRLEGLTMGADDYLTKPFNLDLLRLRIDKFLEWAERNHKAFSGRRDVSPKEITITPIDEQFVAKAVKDVEDHFSDGNYSVEKLGAAVGMSRSHLYKKILRITGKTPVEFIRTLRMKRACMLLERGGMQIAEVGYAVGYNTPKRFTENFKEQYGMTPSEYLRQLQAESHED